MLQLLRGVWFSLQDENAAPWLLGYFVTDSEPQSDILEVTITKTKTLTKIPPILVDLWPLSASQSL